MSPTQPQIDRINELSQLARTAWFSLLGYLVFVGITLLGVRDADFFVPSRQTDLPLVNVAIPTASFFWTAPILGAALYTYLHLFLIKLWDAHGEARTADADPTHHWLVNDFVLIRQRDPVARARPLWRLTDWITRFLVWAAGPIVLGYAWWRSMPAHNEWLTLLVAACFWLTLVVGFTSWWRAEERLGGLHPLHWSFGSAVPSAGLLGLLLIGVSWLRTEGGLDEYADGFWTLDDVTFSIPADTPVFRWWLDDYLTLPLARTDLAGVELVALPDDWRSPETARGAFRESWCKREGLAMEVCDQPAGPEHAASASVAADRLAWCGAHGGLDRDACAEHFADLDRRFAGAWAEERGSTLTNLPALDLRGRDLRRAAAPGTSLVGAILVGARMEGADLWQARLEGANLWQARLDGAELSRARLEGANLKGAELEGASLVGARLGGAVLEYARLNRARLAGARLDGAYLRGARLEGANLLEAQLEGADLSEARLDQANLFAAQLNRANLSDARLAGADLRAARLEGANLSRAQLQGAELQQTSLRKAQLPRADLRLTRLQQVDLRSADFRNSNWAGALAEISPAHSADLRGAQGLRQAQLDGLIGNADTLLPDALSDTGESYYIWSCWETPPDGFGVLLLIVDPLGSEADRAAQRAEFLCGPDSPRRKTGTALAVDAPYPVGHPLGGGD